MWSVYFLKSDKKEWYYVGSTNRLNTRIKEHNQGKVDSTRAMRPLRLVYTEEFFSENEARNREQQLKHKRVAKEEIIRQIENQ